MSFSGLGWERRCVFILWKVARRHDCRLIDVTEEERRVCYRAMIKLVNISLLVHHCMILLERCMSCICVDKLPEEGMKSLLQRASDASLILVRLEEMEIWGRPIKPDGDHQHQIQE